VLEEVRLLGNLDSRREKLLQIVLAGQPEFDRKLDAPSLRQLKQRIALRCTLQPFARPNRRVHRHAPRQGRAPGADHLFAGADRGDPLALAGDSAIDQRDLR